MNLYRFRFYFHLSCLFLLVTGLNLFFYFKAQPLPVYLIVPGGVLVLFVLIAFAYEHQLRQTWRRKEKNRGGKVHE